MQQQKKSFSANLFLASGLLSSLTISLVNTQPVQASSLQLNFIGQSIIPTVTQYQGTTVGGLSGITYDSANNSFYTISDDRSQVNPARFYTANIDTTQFNANGVNSGVTFTGVTTLLQLGGTTFPALSLDPEAITLVNGNQLFISSEGNAQPTNIINPFVNRFSLATGQQNFALPVNSKFNPVFSGTTQIAGIRNNLAFESLTATPNSQFLFTATENAIVQDGPVASLSSGTPSRIIQYDLNSNQEIAEFLYYTDPVALPPNPSNAFNTNGLVDLLALDNTGQNFLALERSFSSGAIGTPGNMGNTVKIFQVSLAGSSNIINNNSLIASGTGGIIPAQKTLLLDLTNLGIPIDNVEGMTFGSTLPNGQRSLILVSDNNFSSTQFTQFLAFGVQSVPEPTTTIGLLIFGIAGLIKHKNRG
ncbi:esterase-like activity of phytase family protein [Aphanothece sacrum]|uniref:3-phytase n=1 Tax=Aphanothece sacrum FPU1 TaxID=1920663 RepID=A0A401INH8_APHSA|nr:esterase-like activity of phytase family protein [Aphanothece sacrum]GBF82820.1 3-phytase [Aphanothece sacrum FPU1]GBF85945.1 myo-inositol-hexaphosphate 3-phosphohydrolase [Aphanothece sacrum FPU3]